MRLRSQVNQNPAPVTFAALAHSMESAGRWGDAADAAREGLQLFPFSRELQDILRINWERHSCVRAAELDARVRSEQTLDVWLELIEFSLQHSKLDAALQAAERMGKAHPEEARSWVAGGQVHLHLFLRDHLARDGDLALAKLLYAVSLDPECFEARMGLAEAYFHIGATSKAAIQIMVALELNPDHEEAHALSRSILALPPEKVDPRELLINAEETDEVWTASREPGLDEGRAPVLREEAIALSQIPGVSQVVLCHRQIEISATGGVAVREEDGDRDPLLGLTQFRGRAGPHLCRRDVGPAGQGRQPRGRSTHRQGSPWRPRRLDRRSGGQGGSARLISGRLLRVPVSSAHAAFISRICRGG